MSNFSEQLANNIVEGRKKYETDGLLQQEQQIFQNDREQQKLNQKTLVASEVGLLIVNDVLTIAEALQKIDADPETQICMRQQTDQHNIDDGLLPDPPDIYKRHIWGLSSNTEVLSRRTEISGETRYWKSGEVPISESTVLKYVNARLKILFFNSEGVLSTTSGKKEVRDGEFEQLSLIDMRRNVVPKWANHIVFMPPTLATIQDIAPVESIDPKIDDINEQPWLVNIRRTLEAIAGRAIKSSSRT